MLSSRASISSGLGSVGAAASSWWVLLVIAERRAEFLDAVCCECDDRVLGVVVFFEAECLAGERSVDVFGLAGELDEFAVALVAAGGCRSCEFVA
jgi:hypothetical protein